MRRIGSAAVVLVGGVGRGEQDPESCLREGELSLPFGIGRPRDCGADDPLLRPRRVAGDLGADSDTGPWALPRSRRQHVRCGTNEKKLMRARIRQIHPAATRADGASRTRQPNRSCFIPWDARNRRARPAGLHQALQLARCNGRTNTSNPAPQHLPNLLGDR